MHIIATRIAFSRREAALFALSILLAAPRALAHVPPPSETPAKVIVSGRTSTLVDIEIVKVGRSIPRTFSGDRVKNVPGYTWYVSRHYALRSELTEKQSREFLLMSELAYPLHVWVIGKEPAGIETTRIALSYSKNMENLRKASDIDCEGVGWRGGGGGVTLYYNKVAYNYPSGGLKYHKRDLVIHENLHALHMVATGTSGNTPVKFTEGITYALANHVYDPAKKRLTVMVLDKPTINNPFDTGMQKLAEDFRTAGDFYGSSGGDRGYTPDVYAIWTQFMWSDPERCMKFKIWRDEMFRAGITNDAAKNALDKRLMESIFGPADEFDRVWRSWVAQRRSSFHYIDWGWEQEGDMLRSYGWPNRHKYSQTNLCYEPRERVAYDPLRMDWPRAEQSDLVGEVKRGINEPVVGCLIDYSRHLGRGRTGMGLGVVEGAIDGFEGALFTDRAGTGKGVTVTAWKLGEVAGDGAAASDVKKGRRLGSSVDARIGIGLNGSCTKELKEKFVVEWKGWLRVDEAKTRTLEFGSDDGGWLWLDGKQLVDNGGHHGMTPKSVEVELEAGMHELRILVFQGTGGFGVKTGFVPDPRPGSYNVWVNGERELHLDGSDIDFPSTTVEFPKSFKDAVSKRGHQIGLTITIGRARLLVRARAGEKDAYEELEAAVDLTPEQRRRLMGRHMAVLSKNGRHGITPYIDDARRAPPDLTVPAPRNRWRFAGEDELYGLYRAAWHLGRDTPYSLRLLKEKLTEAADAPPERQARGIDHYHARVAGVVRDLRRLRDREKADLAIADVLGLQLVVRAGDDLGTDHEGVIVEVTGPAGKETVGTVEYRVHPARAVAQPTHMAPVAAHGHMPTLVSWKPRAWTASPRPARVEVTAHLMIDDQGVVLKDEVEIAPSIPRWMYVGPFDDPRENPTSRRHPPERAPVDLSATYRGSGGRQVRWREAARTPERDLRRDHVVDLKKLCGKKSNVSAYAFTVIETPDERAATLALGSDDGVVAWLNGEKVHEKIEGRGYSSKEDKVEVTLKKGRNELLLRVTQMWGGWAFGAHLLDAEGKQMCDLDYHTTR